MQSMLVCSENLLKLLKCYRRLGLFFSLFGELLLTFVFFFREMSLNYYSLRVRQSDSTWQGSSMLLLHWQKVRDPWRGEEGWKSFSYNAGSQCTLQSACHSVWEFRVLLAYFFWGFTVFCCIDSKEFFSVWKVLILTLCLHHFCCFC